MSASFSTVRLGTRGSALACWQTEYVRTLLQEAWPDVHFETQVISTQGDRIIDTPLPLIGGKGLFTLELEDALRSGQIDVAVHSLKDLPTELPAGLTLGAVPTRANPADVLVSRTGGVLATLHSGATIGTSSKRRAAQILHARPDLHILNIRGNVDTRVAKTLAADGPYDATILAYAGLERLERLDEISETIEFETMLPAPGQGALGVQCRDEDASCTLLAPLVNAETTAAVTAERAFLAALGGGCSTPVSALGTIVDDMLSLLTRVSAPDGSEQIEVEVSGSLRDAEEIGQHAAEQALAKGAAALIEETQGNL